MEYQTKKYIEKRLLASIEVKASGFTLVEVLLATSLSFLIMVMVATFLVLGIRFYERAGGTDASEEAGLFFEKITKDLRKSTNSVSFPLRYAKNRLSFVILKTDPAGSEGEFDPILVEYEWNSKKKTLSRSERPLSDDETVAKTQDVLSGVELFKIVQKEGGRELPSRVSVSVDLDMKSRVWHYEKHITIPMGYDFAN